MSWFSKMTTSTVIITCCSALVTYYLSNVFIIVENVDEVFVNMPDPVFKQINASQLHDYDIILECKAAMFSIFKTLKTFVITTYVYNGFEYIWYDDRHDEIIIERQTTS